MISRPHFLSLALGITFTVAHAVEPKDVFKDATVVWQFAQPLAADSSVAVKVEGAVKTGVELKGREWEESLARGGDGKVAEFDGGVLVEVPGATGPLSIGGEAMTVLLRVRGGKEAWKNGEIFARHGGHDATLFNMHVNTDKFGFEFGVQEKKGLAARLAVPLESIAKGGWHEVIARYDGARLALFVDGVSAGSIKVAGHLRSENKLPFTLGKALRGQVDHAALWTRALSDAEIMALSGGAKAVAEKNAGRLREIEKVTGRADLKLVDKLRATRELREQIQADPLRPRWHLGTPDGVWNDINGTVYWKGRYHVFFQSLIQPDAATVLKGGDIASNRKEWTHASSADLVHWVYHGTALRPVFDGSQPKGLYSGDMIDGADVPTLIYHIPGQGTAIAKPVNPDDPELIEWQPIQENPVISLASAPEEVVLFDPFAWKEGDTYFALVGNKNKRPGYEGDSTSLYRSRDLLHWEYRGPLYKSDRKWTAEIEDCACPDFYPIGQSRHMLLMHSHMPYFQAQYYIGKWDAQAERFTPESHSKMNWPGGHLSAPETLLDGKGRRIFWGWVREARKGSTSKGWGSIATLLQSVGIGITNLGFTFLGLWLIDRLGRRTLLLIGSFGYIASLGLCAWAFFTGHFAIVPACIFAFIAAHAIGQALGSAAHWVFAALLTTFFPAMVSAFAPGWVFLFSCGMMVLQLIWVKMMMPETKGVPLEDIQKQLSIGA